MKTFSKYIINKLLECHKYTKKYINQTIKPIIINKESNIIAIGDIHGDIKLMLDTLIIGGVIKKTDKNTNAIKIIRKDKNDIVEYYEWFGKNTIVVQVGDQIDRCRLVNGINNCHEENVTYDDEASDIEILLFFTNLHEKAIEEGGAVYSLLGNHELMNICINDIRYVSYKNLEQLKLKESKSDESEETEESEESEESEEEINEEVQKIITSEENNINEYMQRRINIFRRGGVIAKFLASTRYSILIVNGYLFVHGGVLGSYIEKYNNNKKENFQDINNKIKNYIIIEKLEKEQEQEIYQFIFGADSPFYTRKLGQIEKNKKINDGDCKDINIKELINDYDLKSIIVGHTPQIDGINGTCLQNGKKTLFRIDVASSKAFHLWPENNLQAQVLKISNNDETEILKFKNGKNGKIISEEI